MLPRGNRLRRPADFDRAVRQGRRAASKTLVVHVLGPGTIPASGSPRETLVSGSVKTVRGAGGDVGGMTLPRVGFVVTKAVGNSVQRNRVKRRLRHASHARLSQLFGLSVVIRANPAAGSATSAQLVADLDRCLSRVRDGAR